MKSSYYYIIIGVFILGTTFYINDKHSLDEEYFAEMLEERKAQEYEGKILKLYEVKEGRYPDRMISLSDGSETELNRSFWSKCAVGDSIKKVKGESFITLKKQDGNTILFDHKEFVGSLVKDMKDAEAK